MDIPSSRTDFDADVVVIGAGPIGLIAACALRHYGVSVRVFEKRTKARESSRANNVWARPQELLEAIALRGVLAEKSYKVTKQSVLVDRDPLEQSCFTDVASPFPAVLYSGQDVIEKTLIEQVEARGAILSRGHQVTTLAQDADGVSLTVEQVDDDGNPSGTQEEIRCRYLVGADGNDGFVRGSLGLDFEPTKLPRRSMRQIDAKLTWQRSTDHDQLWFFTYHHGFAGILPVWEGYHRLFFLEDETFMPERDPTLEEMQSYAREIIGDESLTLTDPIWTSYSRFQHGVAAAYAKGRVFLAGDAGHTTLPIGGQGMNAGMHDAVGIAWRLAMTIAGHASPVVLTSYGEERQAQHASLDKQQTLGFDQLTYRGRIGDAALGLAGKFFPGIGTKVLANDDLQQLSVAYPDSPLTDDHVKSKSGSPVAGDRAPNAAVIDADGKTVTLFPLIYNAEGWRWGWNLFGFDGGDAEAVAKLRAAGAAVAQWTFVRTTLILAAPAAMKDEATARDSLSDLDGVAHAAYGLKATSAMVLMRPDGHIAFRAPADRADLLQAYCDRTFAVPSERAA